MNAFTGYTPPDPPEPPEAVEPPEPYDLILSDPNWRYNNERKKKTNWRSANTHYKTDTLATMWELNPIPAMARDSMLALWVTGPMFERAFDMVRHWNSFYKLKREKLLFVTVLFVWTKSTHKGDQKMWTRLHETENWQFGNGKSTRSNCEYVLGFRRGRGITVKDHAVRQQIIAPLQRRNSEKPDDTNFRLERLYGDLVEHGRAIRRAELYARRELPGWDCVGDQVPGRSRRIEDWLVAFPPPPEKAKG